MGSIDAATVPSADHAATLGQRLRHSTRALHRQAERSGYVAEILRGRAEPLGYALLLRNLHPAYATLEAALAGAGGHPALAPLRHPPLQRAAPLARDLTALAGPDWHHTLPLLPAGARYAAAVAAAGGRDGVRLVGHAYVRYLGDLSGGQILARLLARSLGLGQEALNFYEFGGDGTAPLERRVRRAIDLVTGAAADLVLAEAALAFRLNIDLSRAVAVSAAGPRQSARPDAQAAPSSG